MAKAATKLVITSKDQMYKVVQQFMVNSFAAKQLADEMKKQSDAIKEARERLRLPIGPAPEFDGPHGGITFGSQDQIEWSLEAIKSYLGKKTYDGCIEVSLKSASKPHLIELINGLVENGKLTQDQRDEIFFKTGETIKLVPVHTRVKE